MSVSYTSGKKAGGFYLPNGQFIYVLFEKTRDGSLSPSVPNWSCYAVGDYASVMRNMVAVGACDVAGGALQNGSGYIKPENYIFSWKREMENVDLIQMEGKVISLQYKRNVKYTGNENDDKALKERTVEILQKHNKHAWIDTFVNGDERIVLEFDKDYQLIMDLFWVKTGTFSAYKIFSYFDVTGTKILNDIQFVKEKAISVKSYKVYQFGEELMMLNIDGLERKFGFRKNSDYKAMAIFINEIAIEAEIQCPGSSKAMIKDFKDDLNNAIRVNKDYSYVNVEFDEEKLQYYSKSNIHQILSSEDIINGLVEMVNQKSFKVKASNLDKLTKGFNLQVVIEVEDPAVKVSYIIK